MFLVKKLLLNPALLIVQPHKDKANLRRESEKLLTVYFAFLSALHKNQIAVGKEAQKAGVGGKLRTPEQVGELNICWCPAPPGSTESSGKPARNPAGPRGGITCQGER